MRPPMETFPRWKSNHSSWLNFADGETAALYASRMAMEAGMEMRL
jgi:hypothetical protein